MSSPTDRLRQMYSGIPQRKRDERLLAMLQVFIDDSKTGNDVLVLAGYVGHWKRWEQFSVAWQALLDEFPEWSEFKMARAARHPDRSKRFYKIVADHVACHLVCVVEIAALRSLCDELALPAFCRNPYNWALKALPGAVYKQLGAAGSVYPMDFIFDERGEKVHLRAGWPYFILGMPPEAQGLIGKEPKFELSHEVLPLQAAEIIAWHAREHWLKHKKFDREIDLSWPQTDRINGLVSHWDYDALKPNMESLRQLLLSWGYPLDPLPD